VFDPIEPRRLDTPPGVGPRGLTSFVGCRTDLQTLREALLRASAKRSQLVAVTGEPGVEKFRHSFECLTSPHHGQRALEAVSQS
jgi:hypothetical protein